MDSLLTPGHIVVGIRMTFFKENATLAAPREWTVHFSIRGHALVQTILEGELQKAGYPLAPIDNDATGSPSRNHAGNPSI